MNRIANGMNIVAFGAILGLLPALAHAVPTAPVPEGSSAAILLLGALPIGAAYLRFKRSRK